MSRQFRFPVHVKVPPDHAVLPRVAVHSGGCSGALFVKGKVSGLIVVLGVLREILPFLDFFS